MKALSLFHTMYRSLSPEARGTGALNSVLLVYQTLKWTLKMNVTHDRKNQTGVIFALSKL